MADHCNTFMVEKYLADEARDSFPCCVCGLECGTWPRYVGHLRGIPSTDYPQLSTLEQQQHDTAWYGDDDEDPTLQWGVNVNHEDESSYVHEGGDHLNGNGKLLVMG